MARLASVGTKLARPIGDDGLAGECTSSLAQQPSQGWQLGGDKGINVGVCPAQSHAIEEENRCT